MHTETHSAGTPATLNASPGPAKHRLARGHLLKLLRERLDRRQSLIDTLRDRWMASADDLEVAAITLEWDSAYFKFEATRKALIRTQEGMPYWKFGIKRAAEIEADGWVFTPAGAMKRKVPKCDTACSKFVRANVPYREAVSAHRAMLTTLAEIDASPLGWVDDDIVEVIRTADNARRAILLAYCADATEAAERVQYFKDFWQRESKDSDVAEQATAEIDHVAYHLSVSLKYPNDAAH